jgi:hypothetical protein
VLDSTTLALKAKTALVDPRNGGANRASLPDDGTASPTIGPDGKVYIGVLESPFKNSHGWMLQFNANLTQQGTPGAFGWDDTSSIIPSSIVQALKNKGIYTGDSSYLLMTKYNDYADFAGGTGLNKLAILDPNDTQIKDGVTVMKEVETVTGITPDPDFPGVPGAVREWCINSAAVDPFTNSVIVNSEDGNVYRWDLLSDSLQETVNLTPGVGEAYTPTEIGPDGAVYAVNNGILFHIVPAPEPGPVELIGAAGLAVLLVRRFRSKSIAKVKALAA